jgi:hypothetical protein
MMPERTSISSKRGARSQELLIFLLGAETHDALNTGAVVPAPVE